MFEELFPVKRLKFLLAPPPLCQKVILPEVLLLPKARLSGEIKVLTKLLFLASKFFCKESLCLIPGEVGFDFFKNINNIIIFIFWA
jgi:hypothetical protein